MREPLSAALRIALILCFLPFLSFAQDNALLFDGVDDHVFVAPGPLFDGTQTITFEAWVNPASVAGTDAIASWIDGGGNEATFSIAAGFLALTQNNGTTPATLTGSQNINANEWTHVALVITVGSLNFYVNGVEEIMGTPDPQAGAADMFSIGVSAVSADYFSGLIDEVRIWDTAIDEAQLNSQMFTSLVGNEANLIAYYQFDETTGTILPDLTSSSYDGSLVSFPASTDPNWQASAALTEVFTVINNNDDLVGSFRQAIVDANASVADSVRVEFNFAAPLTLSLVTQLPNITRSMAIDGTTLPTFNFATENMVTLDLSSVINGDGFHIQSVDVSIIGIKLEATQFGVVVNGEAYDNAVIQQNIFEANTTTAISVNNGDNVTIAGNHIGVSGDGLAGTTGGTGIALSGTDGAIIGGDRMAGEGNMIAGSEFSSDLINISGSDFITIEGNILGASTSGSDITNSRGITINNTDNVAIGSADANRRNYIAGIDNAAALSVSNGNQVHIRNNYVGIGIVDTHAIGNNSGNAIPGIRLSTGITNFTIDGNVVSGASQGVNLAGTTNTGSILNNLIGVRPDGTTAFGNTTHGINLTGSSLSAITIGGGGGENIIAYNNIGIRTDQTSFGTIEISENSILCNTTTGIDISGTPAIAAPVISSIRPTTISGTTTSEDNSNILIYEVDASCAGTQGETFIMEGSDVVSGGTWTVSGTFDIASSFVAVVVDDVNSVDAEFGSSEFSAPAAIDPFTVIITDDSGVGSLRWAVGNANSSVDEETITFDLPGVPATWVITTTTAISISGNSNGVIIDGTSQSGYTQWVDMVQIDGPDGFTAATLSLSEPNVEVYGLHFTDGRYAILTDASAADFQIGSATDGNVFQSANQFGLNITGTDGGTIQGNRIGTSKDGLSITGTGASSDGIYLSGASNIQIGGDRFAGEGNLISGNGSGTDYAIDINSSSTTQIEGNLIGTDANGENDLGNTRGINVAGSSSSFTTIGGASPSAVNVIAGNSGAGITVQSAVDNLSIENNLIGITATDIGHSNNRGISIIALGTGGQIIDNTISANTGAGIYLDQFTNDLLIQNNIIGLTTAGVSALGIRNSAAGIQVRSVAGADATTGRVQILDNVITGNGGGGTQNHGIFFQKSGQDIANFLIQRNNIGVESDGSAPSANSTNSRGGIGFSSTITAANDVTIGGLGNENIIAHNFQEGIYFEMAAEPPGLILDINQYFCNGNDAINFTLAPTVDAPVITSATGSGISGTTTSTSGTVEIFSVDASCADNQGATHVGTATISTGTWSLTSEPFDRTLTYVAYVNDATSGPSEFSAAFEPDPFIVTNTDDSGIGSLRWCITNANASASKETITFDIAGVGPWTIPILSQLPTIDLVANLGMIIDGASQPTWDMDAGLMVTLDGSGAGAFDLGLRVEEPNVEIYGLHIINFDRGISSTSGMDNFTIGAPNMGNVIGGNNYGLFIFNTSGGLIQGNRIGTSMDGLSTNGNSEEGIRIASASDNIQIGGDSGAGEGNLISGNGTSSAEGIQIDNADFIQLYGNLIGTNRNGEDDLGNRVGVLISTGADNIDIGSSTANHGNVISGSDAVANIYLSFTPTNVIIENNIIGLNSSGDTGIDAAGTVDGIHISGNALGVEITGNTISGMSQNGIEIGNATLDVEITNNFIGTNSLGTGVGTSLSNLDNGIYVGASDGINNLADRIEITGNVISGNASTATEAGIDLAGSATNILIQNNNIGVETNGTTALANSGRGIIFSNLTSNIELTGNVVANNTSDGIFFEGAAVAPATLVLGTDNSYFCNGGLGINIDNTPTVDVPVITSVSTSVISGTSGSTAGTVEVFTIDATCADNQGAVHVETATIQGDGSWSISMNAPYDHTATYTAYVDDASNGVSEFGVTAAMSPFITTWSTTDNEITIPITGTGYNYDITWTNLTNATQGDGSSTGEGDTPLTITGLNNTDVYQIEITGAFPRIYFNSGSERLKIRTVQQWGDIAWTSMAQAFLSCDNLTVPAIDAPDLSGVTDVTSMFHSCPSLTSEDFNNWDVSNVQNMTQVFAFSQNFDGNVDMWNVSNVTTMYGMFWDARSFTQDLNSWTPMAVTDISRMFQTALTFNGNIDGWNMPNLTVAVETFYQAHSLNQSLNGWSFGMLDDMTGMFRDAIIFNGNISSWDVSTVTDMTNLFSSALVFDQDISGWETGNVTTLEGTFAGSAFNGVLATVTSGGNQGGDAWDVSSVTNFTNTFTGATDFNQDLNWTIHTGGPVTMQGMFNGATSFDGNISAWNVSEVTNMSNMFMSAAAFTGDLSGWQVSNVTEMNSMFQNAILFNANIGSWNTISVNTMTRMFQNASDFNQDMNWNVSGVTNMEWMFSGATNFNGNISSWVLTSLDRMSYLFENAVSFNGDISGWDVTEVDFMQGTFSGASSFNQDISGWVVGGVTTIQEMFAGATSFNQDLSNWDVSNVTTMFAAFNGTTAFNQSLGAWDIGNVTNMASMLNSSGLSVSNFDATLIGWLDDNGGTETIPSGITLGAIGLGYCTAADALTALVSPPHSWVITGPIPDCSTAFIVTNTDDLGEGSLRWTIDNANLVSGANTITFNIPNTDGNYLNTGGIETWTIAPVTDLSPITDQLTLDATSQPGTGNFRIILDGLSVPSSSEGLHFNATSSAGSEIFGFYITNWNTGIRAQYASTSGITVGSPTGRNTIVNSGTGISFLNLQNGTIQSNYIGTDEDGSSGLGNSNGIQFTASPNHTIGGNGINEGNVISDNTNGIAVNASAGQQIIGNLIGTAPDGLSGLGNSVNGINLATSSGHTITGNVISGNPTRGLHLSNASNNTIQDNYLGVGLDGTTPVPNGIGIETQFGSTNTGNQIGGLGASEPNIIANNTTWGVALRSVSDLNNQIIGNQIFCNGTLGIHLQNGANNNMVPPTITALDASSVSGTGISGDGIHLYRSNSGCVPGQGEEYLGTAVVDGLGDWTITGLTMDIENDGVTATSTHPTDGTSEFSAEFVNYPQHPGAGNSLVLDGVDDYVDLGDPDFTGTTALTVEAWINPADIPNGPGNDHLTIIGKGAFGAAGTSSFGLYLYGSDGSPFSELVAVIDNGSSTTSARYDANNLNTGEWAHVALTWSSGNGVTIYINGVNELTGAPLSGTINVVGDQMQIGTSALSSEREFEGQIDEIRIWDAALSETTIRDWLAVKYESGAGHPNDANLIAYYRCDDLAGTVLGDLAGSLDGSLNGGATFTTSGAYIGDESAFTTTTSVALGGAASGNNLTVNNIQGSPDITYLYRVNEAPNDVLLVAGLDVLNTTDYYGVFQSGGSNPTFNAQWFYSGNLTVNGQNAENGVRFMKRENNADGNFYEFSSSILDVDSSLNIVIDRNVRSGEFGQGQVDPYPTPVPPGNALTFDGVDDYIDLGTDLESVFAGSDKAFTIEAWINPETFTGDNRKIILAKNGNSNCGADERQFSFVASSDEGLRFTYYGANDVSQFRSFEGGSISTNTWQHVAVTYDGSVDTGDGIDRVNFYINGILQTTVADGAAGVFPFNISSGPSHVGIGATLNSLGALCDNPDHVFDGPIDEVRIWDTTLDNATILAHVSAVVDNTHPNYENLVSYHRFDDSDGSASIAEVRDLAGTNDGVLNGFPGDNSGSWSVSGALDATVLPNNAIDFDGTNDHIDIGDPVELMIAGDLTLEAWVNWDGITPSHDQTIVGRTFQHETAADNILYQLGIDSEGKLFFHFEHDAGINSPDLSSIDVMPNGEWIHVAAVRDATAMTVTLYLNGVPLSMVTGTYPNNANGGESSSQRVMIGRRNPNNFDYFDGRIDEVRIWNSPRTLGEIQTNLYAALDGSETGLVAYYNFDQGVPEGSNGSETTLFDITANGNDGLLTGMALTGANSNWVSSQFETPFASSDLFTTEVSSSQIDLSWTDNALNETGYTIERSDGNNFSYSFLATAASDATSFSDNTVSLASGYFYRVVANGMYDSNPSNEKFGSTIAPPGVALEFDGVDDFVDLSSSVDNLTFSAPATIEFWAKINYDHTVASNFKTILSLGEFANDEFVIGIGDVTVAETNELLAIQVTTAGGANRTVVNYLDGTDITGQWHHYAVTADGTNYQLYFDGHPVAATTVVGGGFTSSFVGDFGENITSPSAAYIGQREGQGQFFDGEIDELRVWNDVRTPVEILSNLTVPLVGNEANLVSYYKFDQDEPTDLLLPDRSTNNFDGSWTDAGGGTTVPQWVASEIGFFTVVNTNDSGSGSLRWCIDNANANPGKDMINFAIPPTDPGYVDNSGYETWTISPTTNLPSLTEEVIIDGSTQTGSGQFNVILDGLSGATRAFGLASSNNEIYGLYITDFDVGIHVNATNGSTIGAPTKGNTIVNCSIYGVQTLFADNMIYYANYIGTDEFGNTGLGNDCGICSQTGSSAHTIGGFGADEFNVISGNNTGIGTNGAGNSFIQANLIGTDPTGMNAVPNGIGINLFSSGGTQIIGNTISGNTGNGILLVSSGGVIIRANIIGLTIDEMNPLGNGGAGIITSGGSPNGVFGGFNEGDGNIIANNGAEGIELVGAGDINIRLLRNEIYCNGEGIALNGGNNGIGAPTISRITVDAVSGTGIVGETIDLYRDNSGCLPYQGQEYLGSDVVDGSGDWEVSGLTLDLSNDYFTATASNGTDGTSAFSASYTVAPINALDFDGVNDRVIVTDDPNLDFGTGGFTIEFWLNASSNTPINQSIGLISKTATFENTPGWSIDINTFADPGVQIDITNGPRDGTGGTAWRGLQYGRWYHVAMVRGSADLKLYIDGIHVNTEFNPVVLGDVSNAENLVIGDSWGIEYEGMLDEIRLWNVERTEAEIQSTILQTLVGDEPNLVAYYNFDHGLPGADNTTPPANVLSDKTANGLDGSLSNFALNGATSNWVNSGSLDPTPNEPVDLTTTEIGSTTIELNWTDQSFNESDFLIYRSDGDNTNFAQIDMVEADAATYPDNSVTPGNGYFYRVVATDGTLNSDPSNEKFGSTITPPGNALDFDGVDDFVDLGDVHDEVFAGADKSFTIESWIYLTAIGSNGEIILSKQGNTNCGVDERQVTFGVREDGILRLGYYGDLVLTQLRTIGGTTVLNLNEWYHVAATYDGAIDANDGLDRVKIYVNGVEETTSILTSTGVLPTEIPSGPAHLAIGSNVSSTGAACSGADQIFSGSIDELRLWNGIRSETEIQNNLSTVLVGNESGLAAYYRFDQDEPTDLILPDRSLNQNDGAWNGNGGGVTTPQWIPSGAFNVDIVPPTVLTQDIVVSLDATGNVSITASQVNNGSSDNIVGPGDLILTLDKSDFDCTELGDNTVTLSVNDGANISSETATVTVIDDMDPVVIVQNISVTLDAEDLATITTISVDNGSSDNCSIALSLDIDSFGKTEVGDNTVTLTATDGSGNSATATATVTVLDNNGPPDFSFIFYLDENSEEGTLIGTVVATDLEDDPLTYSILSGNTNSAFAIGGSSGDITVASQTELDFETTPVFNLMVQASDGNGGESMVSITVNLNDIVDENPLGLEDQLDQINVYPNPAHGSLFLELGVLSLNDLKVHLFTVSGSEVELATRIRSKSVDVLEIGLENLDAGIYLLKIESNKGVVTKNILVR